MVLQFLYLPAQAPKRVHIGGFSSQNSGQRSVGRLAIQPGAADAGSG
jgi:hypothetical protein